MTEHLESAHWEEHDHEAIVHAHRHPHVTHNWSDRAGGFEHLSAEHEHAHDHSPVHHAHYPHEDFEREHRGEAHVHDHIGPVREQTKERLTKKAPAKKAAAAKKAPSKVGP